MIRFPRITRKQMHNAALPSRSNSYSIFKQLAFFPQYMHLTKTTHLSIVCTPHHGVSLLEILFKDSSSCQVVAVQRVTPIQNRNIFKPSFQELLLCQICR